MVSVKAADVLAAKLVSPEYFAVIECIPADSDEVLNVACAFGLSVPVPICVVPSENATAPVAVPLPVCGLTVAVNVTDCPNVAGFAEDTTAVDVAVRTVSLSAAEVLAANPAEGEGK
jgi:hypothetical protein